MCAWGGYYHTWSWWGGSTVMTPVLGIFNPIGSLFKPQHDSGDHLFLQTKISLSISHLVPEIQTPKVGLLFTKMYYLTDFKHFVSIFSLFSIHLTPFLLNLDFSDPSFSQNHTPDRVHFFRCWTQLMNHLWSTPPPSRFRIPPTTYIELTSYISQLYSPLTKYLGPCFAGLVQLIALKSNKWQLGR